MRIPLESRLDGEPHLGYVQGIAERSVLQPSEFPAGARRRIAHWMGKLDVLGGKTTIW